MAAGTARRLDFGGMMGRGSAATGLGVEAGSGRCRKWLDYRSGRVLGAAIEIHAAHFSAIGKDRGELLALLSEKELFSWAVHRCEKSYFLARTETAFISVTIWRGRRSCCDFIQDAISKQSFRHFR